MNKGDCYEANFLRFFEAKNDDFVLVHAMREIVSEWWGGHCFILDTKTDTVYDFSLSAEQFGIGEEGIAKKEIYEQWNIQEDGLYMYFEYSFEDAVALAYEEEHYGAWELLYEMWQHKEWSYYMKEYFMPKFQPKQSAVQELNK